MANINIELPESMMKIVDNQVQAGFFPNPSSFVQSLITDFVKKRREEIERKLLEAVEDFEKGNFTEMTAADWEKLRADYLKRFQEPASHGQ